MKELGKDSKYFHENLAAAVDKFGVDLVFACGDLMKNLFENLSPNKKGSWFENSQKLSEKITSYIQKSDRILVKGSHSMEMNKVVEAIKNVL